MFFSKFVQRYSSLISPYHKLDYRLFQCFVFLVFKLLCVQGHVEICYDVNPPKFAAEVHNCSLVCSLKFEHLVTGMHNEELALCYKNSTIPLSCKTHVDCRQHYIGSFCKLIPCLCKADKGSEEAYVIRSSVRMPKISTCVVPARSGNNPDLPIVPFPWRTLLYVAAIIFLFASCLVCLRWLSPIIRSFQRKRSTREGRERQSPGDDSTLFCPVPSQNDSATTPFTYYFPRGMPRIYRASPRGAANGNRASTRARYVTCAQAEGTLSRTLANQDKPPPYETAVQLPPPAYDEVERAIIETGNNTRQNNQRVEVHTQPSCSISTPANTSSQS